jgi:hypothetical protein
MLPPVFEPIIPASGLPLTHALKGVGLQIINPSTLNDL